MSTSINQGRLFINGKWTSGSGDLLISTNPATGEINWQGPEASASDVDEALQSAHQAFPFWSEKSLEERSQILLNFGNALRCAQKNFAEIISKETGKPLWDSMNEVESMINKISISIDAYHQRCPDAVRDQLQTKLITRHRPHGVVAVLGPFNFPGHLPNGHIIPALLAGNCVVFKSSELTPLVAEEMLRLWDSVNLPPGVLNLIQGGSKTGETLVIHPLVQGIFFTGSYQTGLILSHLLSQEPGKILALEMGGNNPLVIGEISDIQAAAYVIIQSAYLTSGQRCTCARRLILPKTNMGEKLLSILSKMIASITVGSYTESPEPFMGPIISRLHAEKILGTQKQLKTNGGVPLLEMKQLSKGASFLSPGLMDVTKITIRFDDEIFGPFLQVIWVNDFQEAIDEANRTRFGMSAGLLSQNREEYDHFFTQIRAGVINWNSPLTMASSAAPFGGIKCSGNFRPSAYYAADYCAYPVSSIETPNLILPEKLFPGLQTIRE